MTMNLRSPLSMKVILILVMSIVLTSCNESVPKRSTISPGQLSDEEEACPEGFHEETKKEKNAETGEEEEIVECVEDPKVRPTGAVLFKTDFCGCLDSKAVTYGNCSSFCAGRNTQKTEVFFANFSITADVALSGLGSVYGWCNAVLPGEKTNPKCQLEVKNEDGSSSMLDVTTPSGTNSITADISALAQDKTYVLTLVETVSKARSNSVQIVKFSPDIGIPILGPLKNAPISQYTCLVREGGDGGAGDFYFEYAYRMHFYFLPRRPPTPVPAGASIACHDISQLGLVDDVLYPRLELLPGAFNLWDASDPRFFDNNGNTILDVNDIIIQKTKNFGGSLPASANFFSPFAWPNEPELGADDDATKLKNEMPLGFIMAPWIDATSFKSYCLNSSHYNSSNPVYKAIRDVIGVDTEGIYVAEKTYETITATDGTVTGVGYKDVILIRETDLKQVWFYLKNGVPTAPTDENVANVAVFFYYPLNKAAPYIKTSTQKTYQIKGKDELQQLAGASSGSGSGSTNSSQGAASSYPPHDRKLGCVPKF